MASKSSQEPEKAEVIEEQLDAADKLLDRVKVLYEQYFLGIQKQPPTHLHSDVERKLRELSQIQIRNTAQRYRFATTQQKFGSYNSYWRRTLRQIENGTYARNLAKVGRQAVQTGADVPEEILAAMPKRMREQIRRDREAARALDAARRKKPSTVPELAATGDEEVDVAAFIREPSQLRRQMAQAGGRHVVDPSDAEMDLAAFFAEVSAAAAEAPPAPAPPRPHTIPRVPPPPPIAAERPLSSPAIIVSSPPPPQTSPNLRAAIGNAPSPVKRPSSPVMPRIPSAPSQQAKPLPFTPGAARPAAPVESMAGPFPRTPNPQAPPVAPPRRPEPRPAPPPGMTDADVNALYAKYVKAKEAVGEQAGPGAYGKLLKTINQQAPKIMEQYHSKGVEFSVVVKDNQVIIRAKPK